MKDYVRWTEDGTRIAKLFTNTHGRKIRIYSLGQVIEVTARSGEDIEALKMKIGQALAGTPIGMTEAILSGIL